MAGILLTSHYPLYCSCCANIAKLNVTAASWVGPEFGVHSASGLQTARQGELTVGSMQASMLADLEPLMLKYLPPGNQSLYRRILRMTLSAVILHVLF